MHLVAAFDYYGIYHLDAFECLLRNGAHHDVADGDGATPLALAAISGNVTFCSLMVAYGVSHSSATTTAKRMLF